VTTCATPGGAGLPGQALLAGAGHQVGLAVGDELADQVGVHWDHLAPGSFRLPRHDPVGGSSGRSVVHTPRAGKLGAFEQPSSPPGRRAAITTPFGGLRMSGFGGRDNGLEALEQYTALKTIWVTVR
jgi:hypothetical protein